MAWQPELWREADHPRDRLGRFRSKWGIKGAAKQLLDGIVAAFNPREFQSPQQASTHLAQRAKAATPQQKKSLREFSLNNWKSINAELKAGKTSQESNDIDEMMQPSADDMILSWSSGPEAWGLDAASLPAIEEATGKLVRIKGYTQTWMGQSDAGAGRVSVHLLAPRGTNMTSFGGAEVLLHRDMDMRVIRVEENGKGGYRVYAAVMPKGVGGEGKAPRSAIVEGMREGNTSARWQGVPGGVEGPNVAEKAPEVIPPPDRSAPPKRNPALNPRAGEGPAPATPVKPSTDAAPQASRIVDGKKEKLTPEAGNELDGRPSWVGKNGPITIGQGRTAGTVGVFDGNELVAEAPDMDMLPAQAQRAGLPEVARWASGSRNLRPDDYASSAKAAADRAREARGGNDDNRPAVSSIKPSKQAQAAKAAKAARQSAGGTSSKSEPEAEPTGGGSTPEPAENVKSLDTARAKRASAARKEAPKVQATADKIATVTPIKKAAAPVKKMAKAAPSTDVREGEDEYTHMRKAELTERAKAAGMTVNSRTTAEQMRAFLRGGGQSTPAKAAPTKAAVKAVKGVAEKAAPAKVTPIKKVAEKAAVKAVKKAPAKKAGGAISERTEDAIVNALMKRVGPDVSKRLMDDMTPGDRKLVEESIARDNARKAAKALDGAPETPAVKALKKAVKKAEAPAVKKAAPDSTATGRMIRAETDPDVRRRLLENHTQLALRRVAADLGIKGTSRMTKPQLVDRISNWTDAPEPEASPVKKVAKTAAKAVKKAATPRVTQKSMTDELERIAVEKGIEPAAAKKLANKLTRQARDIAKSLPEGVKAEDVKLELQPVKKAVKKLAKKATPNADSDVAKAVVKRAAAKKAAPVDDEAMVRGLRAVARGGRRDEDGTPPVKKAASKATSPRQAQDRVRAAYQDLPKAPGGWVGLADLREHPSMRDLSRAEQDEAIRAMERTSSKVRVTPTANVKGLTARDRAASLRIGDDDANMIGIDDTPPVKKAAPAEGDDPMGLRVLARGGFRDDNGTPAVKKAAGALPTRTPRKTGGDSMLSPEAEAKRKEFIKIGGERSEGNQTRFGREARNKAETDYANGRSSADVAKDLRAAADSLAKTDISKSDVLDDSSERNAPTAARDADVRYLQNLADKIELAGAKAANRAAAKAPAKKVAPPKPDADADTRPLTGKEKAARLQERMDRLIAQRRVAEKQKAEAPKKRADASPKG